MDVFLEKKDPLKKTVKARLSQSDTAAEVGNTATQATAGRSEIGTAGRKFLRQGKALKLSMRNTVFKKSGGQCEYRVPETGRRCESRHFLEVDHIQPRALGGTNEVDNLRALCRTHNLLMAERIFGREKLETFRR